MKTLYVVPVKIQDTDRCFKECGEVQIGGLVINGIPCLPCRIEKCPHEDKTMGCGEHDFEWGKEKVIMRKLRKVG